jgi:hypothetical protein
MPIFPNLSRGNSLKKNIEICLVLTDYGPSSSSLRQISHCAAAGLRDDNGMYKILWHSPIKKDYQYMITQNVKDFTTLINREDVLFFSRNEKVEITRSWRKLTYLQSDLSSPSSTHTTLSCVTFSF